MKNLINQKNSLLNLVEHETIGNTLLFFNFIEKQPDFALLLND